MALKKYNEAILDFTKTIEYEPMYSSAFANRAYAYSEINNYDLALRDINKAISLNPKWNYYYIRGYEIYLQMGDSENAELDLNKAAIMNPDCFECFYRRGGLKMAKGFYKEALSDYEKAEDNCKYKNIIFNIDYLWLQYLTIEAHLSLKEYETALRKVNKLTDFFDVSLKINGYDKDNEIVSEAFSLKAQALYYLKNPEFCHFLQIACKLGNETSCINYQKSKCQK